MNPKTFIIAIAQFGLAGVVLLLSHYNYTWIAAVIVLAPTAYTWFRAGRSWEALLLGSPSAVIGLSVVVLVGLSRPPLGQAVLPVSSQIAVTVAYGAWLVWLRQLRLRARPSLPVLGVQQVAATSAIFLAAAFWHWPEVLVVVLTWGAIAVTTLWYLRAIGERAAMIMATAWALIAAELAWVLFAWQVNYVIHGGYVIIPQFALVVAGMGYCFASIYQSHTQKRLSRRRLIEYVAITGVLLAIVIAGTRWSGTS
jgi:hypothetical protein